MSRQFSISHWLAYVLGGMLGMVISVINTASACPNPHNWQSRLHMAPIGSEVILNGSSIEMSDFASLNCPVACFLRQLDRLAIRYGSRGRVLNLQTGTPGGVTLQLKEVSATGFRGQMICKAPHDFQPMPVPHWQALGPAVSDLQSRDAGELNRTQTFASVGPAAHAFVQNYYASRAHYREVTPSYAFFRMADGLEVSLVYRRGLGNELAKGALVLVYRKPEESQ